MTNRSLRWLPAVAGVAILVTAGSMALWGGSGTLLFCVLLYFPTLLVICVGLLLWGLAGNRPEQPRQALPATLAAIAVLDSHDFHRCAERARPGSFLDLVSDTPPVGRQFLYDRRDYYALGVLGHSGHGERLVPRLKPKRHYFQHGRCYKMGAAISVRVRDSRRQANETRSIYTHNYELWASIVPLKWRRRSADGSVGHLLSVEAEA